MIEAIGILAAEGSNLTQNVILAAIVLLALVLVSVGFVISRRKKAGQSSNRRDVRSNYGRGDAGR